MRVCSDVDECALGSDCDEHASCQNTEGSYTCTCTHPYSGDGKNCTGNEDLLNAIKALSEPILPVNVQTHLLQFIMCPTQSQ